MKGEHLMLILAATQNTQPDFVALAMVLAIAVIVAIMAIRKRFFTKTEEPEPAAVSVSAEAPELPVAPGSAGSIKLHGVEPKTAAMLMAIVADKMGKPLNELRFISVKEVE
jgi:hypothetical protein